LDFYDVVKHRRSVRAYDSKPVPHDVLKRILETAQFAPSASNRQPWHFIIVTDTAKREKLSKGIYAGFLAESPVVIVGCGDEATMERWYRVDVTIAMEHIVLAATNEGLGTCWVGSFDENTVKEALKLPEQFRVVALLGMGYPREKSDFKKKIDYAFDRRKKLEEIVSQNEYGKPMAF
jgi:nitroreductase